MIYNIWIYLLSYAVIRTWTTWSLCTKTCGGGLKKRERYGIPEYVSRYPEYDEVYPDHYLRGDYNEVMDEDYKSPQTQTELCNTHKCHGKPIFVTNNILFYKKGGLIVTFLW